MDWEALRSRIKADFDAKNAAREEVLKACRSLVQTSSYIIRSVHRGERDEALELIAQAEELSAGITHMTRDHPEVYTAGFVHDAQKEYAEARATFALINGEPLPGPEELGVEYPAYLNGLGEAVGELRRSILDLIREGHLERGDELLAYMDDIYYLLVSFDYPDAITGGLRRTTDMARAIMERTRGDLTTALRQSKLKEAIARLERKVSGANEDM
ncbi:MAG: haloacid dehalogenase [Actinobacteria bacterium]|nr:haloacid dehalogenase [Actinomycetota bacterium]